MPCTVHVGKCCSVILTSPLVDTRFLLDFVLYDSYNCCMKNIKMKSGERHKHMRTEILEMSVAQYAERMQVKEVTVYAWEAGRAYVPPAVLHVLETEYGVSSSWLLHGTEPWQANTAVGRKHISSSTAKPHVVALHDDAHSAAREHVEHTLSAFDRLSAEMRALFQQVPGRSAVRIPMLAQSVSAGQPSALDDDSGTMIDPTAYLVENPKQTYFMRVTGNSMLHAGIADGDTLIVDRAVQPREGHVVIARVYGDLTVKRYTRGNGRVVLKAEHPDFADIPVTADMDVEIVAVVRHVLKKFA